MFETKKKLRHQIEELEKQLASERHHNRRSALVDNADLPKCKSLACYKCEHIVTAVSPGGAVYLLGCGKDLSCDDLETIQLSSQPIARDILAQRGLTMQLLPTALI